MKTVALTQIGLNKKKNEDLFLIKHFNSNSHLFAVADGMGGEAAGEYAAKISLDKMAEFSVTAIQDEEGLSLLVREADLAVFNAAARDHDLEGMGCTLTCTLLRNGILHWSHVGDCRLYLLTEDAFRQITTDQNMAQFLFEEGEISEKEKNRHPSRNQIDQSIGCGECVPVMGRLKVNPGNLIILTTDGIHSELTFDTFQSILISSGDIESKAKHLMKLASDSGGMDDMTLVIAEI